MLYIVRIAVFMCTHLLNYFFSKMFSKHTLCYDTPGEKKEKEKKKYKFNKFYDVM